MGCLSRPPIVGARNTLLSTFEPDGIVVASDLNLNRRNGFLARQVHTEEVELARTHILKTDVERRPPLNVPPLLLYGPKLLRFAHTALGCICASLSSANASPSEVSATHRHRYCDNGDDHCGIHKP
jgi:hypothetical protein